MNLKFPNRLAWPPLLVGARGHFPYYSSVAYFAQLQATCLLTPIFLQITSISYSKFLEALIFQEDFRECLCVFPSIF